MKTSNDGRTGQRSGCPRGPFVLAFAMIVGVLLATAMFFFATQTGARAQEAPQPLEGRIVVIDPGHGGTDPGALNGAYKLAEKDQNLIVADDLKVLLEGAGATVYMTRTGDTSLTNTQRARFANQKAANVLLSVHMNASSNTSTDYTTALFGNWRKDKAFAYAVFGSLKTMPSAGEPEKPIATKTPYSYASGVLIKSDMPAAIAESVFITNKDEAKLLSDPNGARQQRVAQALKDGVVAYLAK